MKTAIFTRKPADLNEVSNPYLRDDQPTPYTITETIRLSAPEYDEFGSDLLAQNKMFDGKGGQTPKGVTKCIAIEAKGRRTLLVNPEGYDYARMVAFA